MRNLKLVFSSIISAFVAVVFVAAITVWAELSAPLKDWLKDLTGHHWVSKGVLMLAIYVLSFIIVYLFSKSTNINSVNQALKGLNWIVILGVVVIWGFFVWHYLAV